MDWLSSIFPERIRRVLRPIKWFVLPKLVTAKAITYKSYRRTLRIWGGLRLFIRFGVPLRKSSELGGIHRFLNRMVLGLSRSSLIWFSLFKSPQVHIVVIGGESKRVNEWHEFIRHYLNTKISYVPEASADNWNLLRMELLGTPFISDLLIIKSGEELPSPLQVLELTHGLYNLKPLVKLGAVHPAYKYQDSDDSAFPGFSFDSTSQLWVEANFDQYNQNIYPRHVLNAAPHCLLIRNDVVKFVTLSPPAPGASWDSTVSTLIQSSWKQGFSTMCYPQVEISLSKAIELKPTNQELNWMFDRQTSLPGETKKVIFTLPATTLSGGIRVVFEIAQGLLSRGFDVEIWSLKSEVVWDTELLVIRQFKTYEDMTLALSPVDAIKVATWWETAEVVFLASTHKGIPIQFVQEFETWFYPDDRVARAAVVASYRPEFRYITIADYQLEELQEIGISAELISVGYDETIYFPISEDTSEKSGMLAVGRSFFQKNFEMTYKAWLMMGEKRPHLTLFGHEPKIISNERSTYMVMPDNPTVNQLYNSSQIFVQTSRHEGFCLPIIEAMASGCPVITTDSHGNRGFCFDGENCIIVEHDDVEGLSHKIEELIGNPQLQNKLRTAGLETATKFSWQTLLEQYSAFYSSVR